MSGSYYNENDKNAAAWLRELIKAGLIADGEVDERSIEDVRPNELAGFRQCHFFAGIGAWSYALRLADWEDDREAWTGSCPCQSFSAAGQSKGFADERHLWPAWFHLIEERRPKVLFGEQVDAAIRHDWIDLVQTDLESIDYAFASAVIPAASVGAPHGRHRVWFVGDANNERLQGRVVLPQRTAERLTGPHGLAGRMEHANMPDKHSRTSIWQQSRYDERNDPASSLEYAESEQAWVSRLAREQRKTAGRWADADWLPCSDGKWRPIEPGTFPLAHGSPARMGRLRGYGNSIVAPVAQAFIAAYMEVRQLNLTEQI